MLYTIRDVKWLAWNSLLDTPYLYSGELRVCPVNTGGGGGGGVFGVYLKNDVDWSWRRIKIGTYLATFSSTFLAFVWTQSVPVRVLIISILSGKFEATDPRRVYIFTLMAIMHDDIVIIAHGNDILLYKNRIFQNILPTHWKMCISLVHENLRALGLKTPQTFKNAPRCMNS